MKFHKEKKRRSAPEKRTRLSLSLLLIAIAQSGMATGADSSTHSVAREWNEELLAAIRLDIPDPDPPAYARNLFHTAATTDADSPAELGKRAADAILAWAENDAFDHLDYPEEYIASINPNLSVRFPCRGSSAAVLARRNSRSVSRRPVTSRKLFTSAFSRGSSVALSTVPSR